MSEVGNLEQRMKQELNAAQKRADERRQDLLRDNEARQSRLAQFNAAVERLKPIWQPRLEVLRKQFADLVNTRPDLQPYSRSITFAFASDNSSITLTFSASPDQEVRNLVLDYDLKMVPILMKFDGHSRLEMPLDRIDEAAIVRWLDDRMMSFVQTYVTMQGDEFFLKNLGANK
jgi:hypothetical protein